MPRPGTDIKTLLRSLRPGASVFLPGSAAEVAPLSASLMAPDAVALDITASFVPGINPMPRMPLAPGARFSNAFACGPVGSQQDGHMAHHALSYLGYAKMLSRRRFDICVVVVAPPKTGSTASLGPAVEFVPEAMLHARSIAVVINPNLPAIPGAATIDLAHADHVLELEAPLRSYDAGEPSREASAIAAGIATLVDDGSALQIGLGKVPDALLKRLTDRRGLRLHSGMLSDGMQGLHVAGALDPDFEPTSCVHVGTQAHYDWLRDRPGVVVAPVSSTHAPATLAALGRLVAVNGAISIDLFGQANLDHIGTRGVSGVGGAADFAAAAARAPEGISIIGLPSTGPGGSSRIVAGFTSPASLPRQDVEVVVTEHGIADLRGLSVMERAERLIAIAAPEHRPALEATWREMATGL